MRYLILLLLSLSASAQDNRQSYIDTLNHTTFLQMGNETDFYYECADDCNTIIMNLNQGFFDKSRVKSAMAKTKTATDLSEQYAYLFKYQGFKRFIVRADGVPEITKSLQ